MNTLIFPEWPQPKNISTCSTTRIGGVSHPPFDSLNLGDHVEDLPEAVRENRHRLEELAQLPQQPVWLEQVHGTHVLHLTGNQIKNRQADAVYTNQVGQVCAIMTADCLPVLFCSRDGQEVAAAHAGWRGLCNGVLENTLAQFKAQSSDIIAWMGPAIGPNKFEVGAEVKQAFVSQSADLAEAFVSQNDKFLANIYLLARKKLLKAGISAVYGGEFCTVSDENRFFSYRREGKTGRMASLIWINN
ncbi:polyphenol oxidase [Providencia alcalifaciens]|uniref:purine nucleoside phosphorylase YfiH n=1 Tax=Providencia alcalifaciens TaxID=126385 RepID=UPI0004505774|nr:purine nucleoside phosphorylase YfiH [Providencia alcalifaciens]ETT06263.1 YfiH family protein [Providencia alcalifaciens F90-2004]EUC93768.1 YfiH family protein [Providencia alcalifaciens PAL-2]MBF0691286.1 polyphenol oxidase [Providencia alcalifaciens]MTB34056.1 polyphenol oxidase [Providencia alcalifaciens]MTC99323.1 polyphenol oxidase [Providencia alcalifaciens]